MTASFRVEDCAIPAVKIIWPRQFPDRRGFFSELFSTAGFAAAGMSTEFVQDNYSRSHTAGVVRGLHFQIPPFAQAKLVFVTRGAIFDVAVDLRTNSPTHGQHVTAVLSAASWNQIFIPVGFAHGFCVLEPDTDVIYKVTAPYSPAHERGILWNDPALRIEWPVRPENAVLTDRDLAYPKLSELPVFFHL